ncbi:glycine dehydrogenase (decarboxylating) [Trichosporon asahii var. asahii CBS 8904]|uniref:Glycine cleavage system H protein n=2 Tax=Trichosporon asahii var. asahii TaxID=189963 RepID=K1VEE7_TRIAC|nr:glycine dehydrogenase (decarboxylating) [Trichosporon asahii var. asahii CBS 2479]EJT52091.1 glycine dehydrogenase (decarboxylating) [Trichosporon asahii var. asahii CBS 2479]EKD02380.1 glycine dehydrogenase (decarboxylating) [Trichosporon asahii var. asahii CBS 8904]
MLALRAFRPAVAATRMAPRMAPVARPLGLRFHSVRYTEDHEWVSYDTDSKVATVGITDYAQKALGDVVFVELPTEGTEIETGEAIGAVESVKAASDIYAPLSGKIVEINEALGDQPSLLNKSPEKDGWLAKIQTDENSQFLSLMDESQYKSHCEGQ